MAKLGQYNLDEMSAQEAFEASAIHLLEQSEKSMVGGFCKYNGKDACCAAAIFIQDYSKMMEGGSWGGLVANFAQTDKHFELVCDLQGLHDGVPVFSWKSSLVDLGKVDGLDTSFLEDWVWNADGQKYIKEV